MPHNHLPDPWRLFLHALDGLLKSPTELHCLGGFVIVELYDFTRVTADVDVIAIRGTTNAAQLQTLAGKGSALHVRHKVYLDIVTIAIVPENYEDRLIDLLPDEFKHLRLMALEPHDLVLAKLTRNIDRDREDVKRLATKPGLDHNVLQERYHAELRHQVGRPEREDLTMELWVEMIQEVQSQAAPAVTEPRS